MSEPRIDSTVRVVVVGWFAREQKRIGYVRLLREHLDFSLSEASRSLESSLTEVAHVVLDFDSRVAAETFVSSARAMGCTLLVVDSSESRPLSAIQKELRAQPLSDLVAMVELPEP